MVMTRPLTHVLDVAEIEGDQFASAEASSETDLQERSISNVSDAAARCVENCEQVLAKKRLRYKSQGRSTGTRTRRSFSTGVESAILASECCKERGRTGE